MQGRALLLFAGRIALALLLLEALTHTLYVNALTRFRAWDRVPAAAGAALFDGRAMAALAFYKLIFLWLKFLVVWRVARLFALADGVDPPENMLRNAPAHPCTPLCVPSSHLGMCLANSISAFANSVWDHMPKGKITQTPPPHDRPRLTRP